MGEEDRLREAGGGGRWLQAEALEGFFREAPEREPSEWVDLGVRTGGRPRIFCPFWRLFSGPLHCLRLASWLLRRSAPAVQIEIVPRSPGSLLVRLMAGERLQGTPLRWIMLGQLVAAPAMAAYPSARWTLLREGGGVVEARLNVVPSAALAESCRRIWGVVASSPATAAALVDQQHQLFERERQISGLQQEMLHASEEERRRLAMEVHDNIGQTLAALGLRAEALSRALGESRPDLVEEAQEIVTLSTTAIRQSRLLARGLDPVSRIEGGLVVAVENFVTLCLRLHRGHIQCDIDPDLPPLQLHAETHLFRIAREALQNALRHGGPGCSVHFRLQADREQDLLRLQVANDADPDQPEIDDGSGLGLRIMQYRTEQLQGRFFAERAEDGGRFTMSCEFPLSSLLRMAPLTLLTHAAT